ncbi:MAG TPA: AMP-binding protein [Acidimicrobiales bacterium]
MLLHHAVANAARRAPTTPALVWDHTTTTFAELDDRIGRLARTIAATVPAGGRVAVLAANHPVWIDAYYGVPAAGRALVFLNHRQHGAEWATLLRRTGARVVIGQRTLLDRLSAEADLPSGIMVICVDEPVGDEQSYSRWVASAAPDPAPDLGVEESDPAWIVFTSGTTGAPKGAVLTHRSILAAVAATALSRPVEPDAAYLYPFPLCHVAGYNIPLHHLMGRPVVMLEGFDTGEVWDAIEQHSITTMSLAPTMIAMLLDDPGFAGADLSSLRAVGYGASAIPGEVLRRGIKMLDVDFSQGFGMTELSGNAVFLSGDDHRRAATTDPHLLDSCGRPSPLVAVDILDEDGTSLAAGQVGEIAVRGPQVVGGYLDDPEATSAAFQRGWFRTGDLGRFDEDGYLYVVDRKKDVIVTGGENVASREVEDILLLHPAVAAAAVIGLPDERWGEQICAVVVPRDTADPPPICQLERLVRDHLGGYKVPRRWQVVDELPTNAAGKILKRELRTRFS